MTPPEHPDLTTLASFARSVGISRQLLDQRIHRRGAPQPMWRIGNMRLWSKDELTEWHRTYAPGLFSGWNRKPDSFYADVASRYIRLSLAPESYRCRQLLRAELAEAGHPVKDIQHISTWLQVAAQRGLFVPHGTPGLRGGRLTEKGHAALNGAER